MTTVLLPGVQSAQTRSQWFTAAVVYSSEKLLEYESLQTKFSQYVATQAPAPATAGKAAITIQLLATLHNLVRVMTVCLSPAYSKKPEMTSSVDAELERFAEGQQSFLRGLLPVEDAVPSDSKSKQEQEKPRGGVGSGSSSSNHDLRPAFTKVLHLLRRNRTKLRQSIADPGDVVIVLGILDALIEFVVSDDMQTEIWTSEIAAMLVQVETQLSICSGALRTGQTSSVALAEASITVLVSGSQRTRDGACGPLDLPQIDTRALISSMGNRSNTEDLGMYLMQATAAPLSIYERVRSGLRFTPVQRDLDTLEGELWTVMVARFSLAQAEPLSAQTRVLVRILSLLLIYGSAFVDAYLPVASTSSSAISFFSQPARFLAAKYTIGSPLNQPPLSSAAISRTSPSILSLPQSAFLVKVVDIGPEHRREIVHVSKATEPLPTSVHGLESHSALQTGGRISTGNVTPLNELTQFIWDIMVLASGLRNKENAHRAQPSNARPALGPSQRATSVMRLAMSTVLYVPMFIASSQADEVSPSANPVSYVDVVYNNALLGLCTTMSGLDIGAWYMREAADEARAVLDRGGQDPLLIQIDMAEVLTVLRRQIEDPANGGDLLYDGINPSEAKNWVEKTAAWFGATKTSGSISRDEKMWQRCFVNMLFAEETRLEEMHANSLRSLIKYKPFRLLCIGACRYMYKTAVVVQNGDPGFVLPSTQFPDTLPKLVWSVRPRPGLETTSQDGYIRASPGSVLIANKSAYFHALACMHYYLAAVDTLCVLDLGKDPDAKTSATWQILSLQEPLRKQIQYATGLSALLICAPFLQDVYGARAITDLQTQLSDRSVQPVQTISIVQAAVLWNAHTESLPTYLKGLLPKLLAPDTLLTFYSEYVPALIGDADTLSTYIKAPEEIDRTTAIANVPSTLRQFRAFLNNYKDKSNFPNDYTDAYYNRCSVIVATGLATLSGDVQTAAALTPGRPASSDNVRSLLRSTLSTVSNYVQPGGSRQNAIVVDADTIAAGERILHAVYDDPLTAANPPSQVFGTSPGSRISSATAAVPEPGKRFAPGGAVEQTHETPAWYLGAAGIGAFATGLAMSPSAPPIIPTGVLVGSVLAVGARIARYMGLQLKDLELKFVGRVLAGAVAGGAIVFFINAAGVLSVAQAGGPFSSLTAVQSNGGQTLAVVSSTGFLVPGFSGANLFAYGLAQWQSNSTRTPICSAGVCDLVRVSPNRTISFVGDIRGGRGYTDFESDIKNTTKTWCDARIDEYGRAKLGESVPNLNFQTNEDLRTKNPFVFYTFSEAVGCVAVDTFERFQQVAPSIFRQFGNGTTTASVEGVLAKVQRAFTAASNTFSDLDETVQLGKDVLQGFSDRLPDVPFDGASVARQQDALGQCMLWAAATAQVAVVNVYPEANEQNRALVYQFLLEMCSQGKAKEATASLVPFANWLRKGVRDVFASLDSRGGGEGLTPGQTNLLAVLHYQERIRSVDIAEEEAEEEQRQQQLGEMEDNKEIDAYEKGQTEKINTKETNRTNEIDQEESAGNTALAKDVQPPPQQVNATAAGTVGSAELNKTKTEKPAIGNKPKEKKQATGQQLVPPHMANIDVAKWTDDQDASTVTGQHRVTILALISPDFLLKIREAADNNAWMDAGKHKRNFTAIAKLADKAGPQQEIFRDTLRSSSEYRDIEAKWFDEFSALIKDNSRILKGMSGSLDVKADDLVTILRWSVELCDRMPSKTGREFTSAPSLIGSFLRGWVLREPPSEYTPLRPGDVDTVVDRAWDADWTNPTSTLSDLDKQKVKSIGALFSEIAKLEFDQQRNDWKERLYRFIAQSHLLEKSQDRSLTAHTINYNIPYLLAKLASTSKKAALSVFIRREPNSFGLDGQMVVRDGDQYIDFSKQEDYYIPEPGYFPSRFKQTLKVTQGQATASGDVPRNFPKGKQEVGPMDEPNFVPKNISGGATEVNQASVESEEPATVEMSDEAFANRISVKRAQLETEIQGLRDKLRGEMTAKWKAHKEKWPVPAVQPTQRRMSSREKQWADDAFSGLPTPNQLQPTTYGIGVWGAARLGVATAFVAEAFAGWNLNRSVADLGFLVASIFSDVVTTNPATTAAFRRIGSIVFSVLQGGARARTTDKPITDDDMSMVMVSELVSEALSRKPIANSGRLLTVVPALAARITGATAIGAIVPLMVVTNTAELIVALMSESGLPWQQCEPLLWMLLAGAGPWLVSTVTALPGYDDPQRAISTAFTDIRRYVATEPGLAFANWVSFFAGLAGGIRLLRPQNAMLQEAIRRSGPVGLFAFLVNVTFGGTVQSLSARLRGRNWSSFETAGLSFGVGGLVALAGQLPDWLQDWLPNEHAILITQALAQVGLAAWQWYERKNSRKPAKEKEPPRPQRIPEKLFILLLGMSGVAGLAADTAGPWMDRIFSKHIPDLLVYLFGLIPGVSGHLLEVTRALGSPGATTVYFEDQLRTYGPAWLGTGNVLPILAAYGVVPAVGMAVLRGTGFGVRMFRQIWDPTPKPIAGAIVPAPEAPTSTLEYAGDTGLVLALWGLAQYGLAPMALMALLSGASGSVLLSMLINLTISGFVGRVSDPFFNIHSFGAI